MAVSPREDAIVALTLAPGESAEQAARHFLSQQGIQGREAWRDQIGGLPAVSYTFDAATQNAQLSGVAAWVEHGDRVFRLLGYTPSNRFRAYGDTLAASLASFDRVTDPRVLNVEPRRVDVVKLRDERSRSSEYSCVEYPSSVPVGTSVPPAAVSTISTPGEQLPADRAECRRERGASPAGRPVRRQSFLSRACSAPDPALRAGRRSATEPPRQRTRRRRLRM